MAAATLGVLMALCGPGCAAELALSSEADARIAFCRRAEHGCQCSVETVETMVTPEQASALVAAMRSAGVVSEVELRHHKNSVHAACDVTGGPAPVDRMELPEVRVDIPAGARAPRRRHRPW